MMTFATVDKAFETAQVVLAGGVRLNYVHGGPAHAPAVIMLHGYTDSSFSFSRVLPLMPAQLRVIAIDQRGHGNSDRPERGYSIDAFADDVIELMDALAIDRATVVGHSMGSFVARRAAEKAPGRIARLVLIGTALSPRLPAVEAMRYAIEALSDPVGEGFVREFQQSTINRPVPAAFFEQVVAESRKLPADVWKQVLDGLLGYQPQWPITCPTTILGGDRDAVFGPEDQMALFFATERSTFHLEPGIGHSLHWEWPERFVSLAFADNDRNGRESW